MNIAAKFYETYNMCAVVDGFLKNTLDNALSLEGFYCEEQWVGWLVLPEILRPASVHRIRGLTSFHAPRTSP